MIHRPISGPAALILLVAWVVVVGTGPARATGQVSINEIRYSDADAHRGHGIEVTRPVGTDLSGATIGSHDHSGGSSGAASDTVTATPERVRISGIQGGGATVVVRGSVTVQAIVTALFEDDDLLSGFFLQEETTDSDGDAATS